MTYCEVHSILYGEAYSTEIHMNTSKELVGASTGLLILGILAQGPNYGYEIVRLVNEKADNFFTWQEGTIYPILRKMEKDGLLESKWNEAGNGRKRKYYHITTQGREALNEGTVEWKGFYKLVMRAADAPGVS